MTTVDFITELFCRVAEPLAKSDKTQKHSQARLYPSEVVTLALLFALKGVGQQAFWRWLREIIGLCFPNYRVGHAYFGCSTVINSKLTTFWPNPRSSA